MDVSQFEIVFKPQSPVGAADTVLQGYFLEISNLEDREYLFQLEFVTSSISDPDRQLAGNTAVLVDRPGSNNSEGFALTGAPEAKSCFLDNLVSIPAHGTALVAVLPSDAFAVPAKQEFETRGYVRLTLPPQNRAQYLAADGSGISDQTQASLPLATGQAVNEVEPGQFVFPLDFIAPASAIEALQSLAADPSGSAGVLAGLMAQIESAGTDLDTVNAALAQAGVGLRVGEELAAEAPAAARRKTVRA